MVLILFVIIIAVNEAALGKVSKQSEEFVLHQCIGSGFDEPKTVLFATNLEVDAHNIAKLNGVESDEYVYEAEDSGDKKLLDKIIAPKVATKIRISL